MVAGLSVLKEFQKRCGGDDQTEDRSMEDGDCVELALRRVVACSDDIC